MRQSHIVAFVTNSLNSMSMVTILPRIPMMVTTPVINLSRIKFWIRLLFIALFCEQYPHPANSKQNTIHPTVPSTVQWTVLQKSRGTNHYSWTVTITIHQTVPQQNHSVYCLLSAEKNFTRGKSNSPSVIPTIPWRIQGFLQSIKGTLSFILQQVLFQVRSCLGLLWQKHTSLQCKA